MRRVLLLFCSVLILCTFLCASKQPNYDNSIDLSEAYKIAYEEAFRWNALAEPYFITSVDDPIESTHVKGENGKRNYWNFDFVVESTSKHLIITMHDKTVVNKIEAKSNVDNDYIINIEELSISTAEAVDIAKDDYGLLPGTDWAQGYHFVLEKEGPALILSVVGLNEKGIMSRVFFNAKTGEVIS